MAKKRRRSRMFWPSGEGPWELEFEWDVVGGRAECVGLTVKWTERQPLDAPLDERDDEPPWANGPEPVTTGLLRSLPFATLVKQARAQSRTVLRSIIEDGYASDDDVTRAEQALPAYSAAGGRPALYPPEHYRQVARVYLEGDPPTKAVCDHYTVPRSTAAKWVAKARRLGFLPPADGPAPGASKREA